MVFTFLRAPGMPRIKSIGTVQHTVATTFIRFGCVNTNCSCCPWIHFDSQVCKNRKNCFLQCVWVKHKWSTPPRVDALILIVFNCPSCRWRKTVWNPLANYRGWAGLIQIIQSSKCEHVWTTRHDGCTSSSTHLWQELSTNLPKSNLI